MANPINQVDFAVMQRQMAEMQQKLQVLARRPLVDDLIIRTELARSRAAENRLQIVAEQQKYEFAKAVGTTAKVGGKICFKIAEKIAQKSTEKVAGKVIKTAAERRLAKWVPGVSLVCGIALAIGRYKKGEGWKKVTGELVSGAAGCFPGPGFLISLIVDGGLIYADYRCYDPALGAETAEEIAISDLAEAYSCLGIELMPEEIPTKEEVDRCYRNISLQLHPDRIIAAGNEIQLDFQRMQAILNRARDLIYESRGW